MTKSRYRRTIRSAFPAIPCSRPISATGWKRRGARRDVARFLSPQHPECFGLPRWQADPDFEWFIKRPIGCVARPRCAVAPGAGARRQSVRRNHQPPEHVRIRLCRFVETSERARHMLIDIDHFSEPRTVARFSGRAVVRPEPQSRDTVPDWAAPRRPPTRLGIGPPPEKT